MKEDNPMQSDIKGIDNSFQRKNDLTDAVAFVKAQYKPMAGGALSPDGTYLWLLRENRTLFRISTIDESLLRFDNLPFINEDDKEIEGNLYDPDTSIVTCSEHCCCYHTKNLLRLFYTDDGKYTTLSYPFYTDFNVIISKDESYILFLRGLFCTIFKLKRDSNTFLVQNYVSPRSVNRDLSLAIVGNSVIDFTLMMKRFNVSEGNFGGVNSLSVTSKGDKALISAGRNDGMEHRKELLYIENGIHKMQIPPFKNEDFQYIIASRISSDGSFYVVSSNSSWSENNELLLCTYTKDRYVNSISTGNSGCLGLDISKDNKYIAAMRGNYISKPSPKIFLLNKNGYLLFEIETSLPRYTDNGIRFSINNQFLLALGHKDYSIFNMVTECPVDINGIQTIPYWNVEIDYQQFTPFIVTLPTPDLVTISNDITNNNIVLMKLTTNEIKTIESHMRVIASSPSGRYIYFLDRDHRLFVSNYPFDKEIIFKPLLQHVRKVIPSYGDNYIYVISDDYTIILYNILEKKTEQKAYIGKSYYQMPCAKGLYVINTEGDVALFKPDDDLRVNMPAITTFVKRWNLENKKLESPSAMCPMCAKRIEFPSNMKHIIKESPSFIIDSDWDNPQLFGHHCPYCNTILQFTPYII